MPRVSELQAEQIKTRSELDAAKNQHSKLLSELGVSPGAEGEAQLTGLETRMRRLSLNESRLESLAESAAAADRESDRAASEKRTEAARRKLTALLPQAITDAAALDTALAGFIDAIRTYRKNGDERHALAVEITTSRMTGVRDLEAHALYSGLITQPASGRSGAITHSLAGAIHTIAEELGQRGHLDHYFMPRGSQIERGAGQSGYTSFAEAASQDIEMVRARI